MTAVTARYSPAISRESACPTSRGDSWVEVISVCFSWIVTTRVWVAGAAASLAWFSAIALGVEAPLLPVAIVFAAAMAIYNFDDLVDGRHRRRARIAVALSSTVLFGLLLVSPTPVQLFVVAGFSASLLYGLPVVRVRGEWIGLKRVPGLKALFVAAALTTATVAVPSFWVEQASGINIALLATFLFLITFTNAVLFDLCDMRQDQRQSVPSLPILFGPGWTRLSLALLHVAFVVWFGSVINGPLLIAVVTSLGLAVTSATTATRHRTSLLVDGLPYGIAAMALMA